MASEASLPSLYVSWLLRQFKVYNIFLTLNGGYSFFYTNPWSCYSSQHLNHFLVSPSSFVVLFTIPSQHNIYYQFLPMSETNNYLSSFDGHFCDVDNCIIKTSLKLHTFGRRFYSCRCWSPISTISKYWQNICVVR